MDIICEENAIIQQLNKNWYEGRVVDVDMLRLDLVHPIISGNKWYKLQRNLQAAKTNGATQVLTFGGAYSNHLVASAAAAKAFSIKSIGIVRGLYAQQVPTATLQACRDMGMQLIYVSKVDYGRKNDPQFLQELVAQYGPSYIIPEGGANNEGRLGAADMAHLIPAGYTHVCVPVGTGTSFIGLRNALPTSIQMVGFAPFKNGDYLKAEIAAHLHLANDASWELHAYWHFGGFGKWNASLLQFMNEFYRQNHIQLDMVYNAKMMFGIKEMLSDARFANDARILCIHTGGLQGNSTVQDQLLF
jgi:1-aminocyclopropane-1-carboxylate deaminase